MEEIGDPKNLPQLLAMLAPGFIILWFRTRVLEGAAPDFKSQILYYALTSAAYFACATPLFHIQAGVTLSPWLWGLLFYFLVPIVLGLIAGWITQYELEYRWLNKIGMQFAHRVPTAWDYRFSRVSEDTFVLVTLKDGTTVAGKMARGSFASSAKDGRDVYIKEIWEIPDEGPWVTMDPSRGMLLCGDDIRYVEFFGE